MKWSILLLAGLVSGMTLRAAPPTATQLADHLDKIRRPGKSFVVRIVMTEVRAGKPERNLEFQVYARKSDESPDFETLAVCLAPESDRGKVLLSKEAGAWLYDPKAARPVAIPKEKFREKFFIADWLTGSESKEYAAEYTGLETIADAAGRERSCHRLNLARPEAKKNSASASLRYWFDAETLRLVRGDVIGPHGKLAHTLYFSRYANVLDGMRPTQIPILSGKERGLVTDVSFQDFSYRDIPARVFTPEALPLISKGDLP